MLIDPFTLTQYYIHSPYELPDCSQSFFLVTGRTERDVAFSSLETTVSIGVDKLSPSQRHCRFLFEPMDSYSRVYSFNLCRMRCRKELSFKLCGCAPYFYARERESRLCGVRVCNFIRVYLRGKPKRNIEGSRVKRSGRCSLGSSRQARNMRTNIIIRVSQHDVNSVPK